MLTWNDVKIGFCCIGFDDVIVIGCDLTHEHRSIIVHLGHHRQGTLDLEGAPGPIPGNVRGQAKVKVFIQTGRPKLVSDCDVRFVQFHWTFDGGCVIFNDACWYCEFGVWVFFIDGWKDEKHPYFVIMKKNTKLLKKNFILQKCKVGDF